MKNCDGKESLEHALFIGFIDDTRKEGVYDKMVNGREEKCNTKYEKEITRKRKCVSMQPPCLCVRACNDVRACVCVSGCLCVRPCPYARLPCQECQSFPRVRI